MATEVNVTDTPTEVMGVSVGTNYFLENQHTSATMYYATEPSDPANKDAAGFKIPPGGGRYAKANTGQKLYVWLRIPNETGVLVFDEAV